MFRQRLLDCIFPAIGIGLNLISDSQWRRVGPLEGTNAFPMLPAVGAFQNHAYLNFSAVLRPACNDSIQNSKNIHRLVQYPRLKKEER